MILNNGVNVFIYYAYENTCFLVEKQQKQAKQQFSPPVQRDPPRRQV